MMVEAVDAKTGDAVPPKNKEDKEEDTSQMYEIEIEEYLPAAVMAGYGKKREAEALVVVVAERENNTAVDAVGAGGAVEGGGKGGAVEDAIGSTIRVAVGGAVKGAVEDAVGGAVEVGGAVVGAVGGAVGLGGAVGGALQQTQQRATAVQRQVTAQRQPVEDAPLFLMMDGQLSFEEHRRLSSRVAEVRAAAWDAAAERMNGGLVKGVLADRMHEEVTAAELSRKRLSVIRGLPLHKQRVWASRVSAQECGEVRRHALWLLQEWQHEMKCCAQVGMAADGNGESVWPQTAPRVEPRVLDAWVLVGSPKQWIQYKAREASSVPLIDKDTAKEWSLEAVQGSETEVWLEWRTGGCNVSRVRVELAERSANVFGLQLPSKFAVGWRRPTTHVPELGKDGSFKWEASVKTLASVAEAVSNDWWTARADEALRECMDMNCEDLGGFFEVEECRPDERVLGSWMQRRIEDAVRSIKIEYSPQETTHCSNPVWALERHNTQVFEAGKLHSYLQQWKEAGADSEVLSWLEFGYHIKLSEPSAESDKLPGGWKGIHKRNGGTAREHDEDFRVVVMEVLMKKAWEVVMKAEVLNVLPMNLAPKPGKSPPWRLILNCMELNEFIRLWSVRYETLRTVPLVVSQGDWIFSIDFTDAYYQLLLDSESQSLVGAKIEVTQAQIQELLAQGLLPAEFVWDKEAELVEIHVRPRGLPMGFKNSCAVWTKTARVLTTLWRRKGFKLVHMIDDLLFAVSGTYEEACAVRDEVLADLDRLGVLVNWRKSVLEPSHCLRFLGMLVDSEVYKFFVPPDKIVKLHELVESMGVMPEATIRALASVVGKVMSMQLAVPAVRMMSAGLYKLVRPEGNWDRSVPLTRVVLSELAGAVDWVRQYSKFGNPIRRFTGMKELRICVDAGTGFGWRIDGADRTAEFEGDVLAKSLEWGAGEEELFQPWKELLALQRCLEWESAVLAGHSVLVRPDATTTVAYVNKGSGPSAVLSDIMRAIWNLCVQHNISLTAEHMAGEVMIATGVDSLSRMAEFAVAPSVFRVLSKQLGFGRRGEHRGYSVDLYASRKTKKCAKYAARGGVEGSIGDARTLQLSMHENFWVLPPLAVVAEAVMTVLEAGVMATVVVPDWPNTPWHVQLRQRCASFECIRWHPSSPVMWDVCVRASHHVHLVDKWDFVAFAVGGSEQRAPVTMWYPRKELAVGGVQRKRVQPEMWRASTRRKVQRERPQAVTVADTITLDHDGDAVGSVANSAVGGTVGERGSDGVLHRAGKRVLRVLSLCDGCGAVLLAFEMLGVTAEVEVVTVEVDATCQEFVRWRFPNSTAGWSHDVRDWSADRFVPEELGGEFWFDLVIAGFPCQDVSTANKWGQGLHGSKSGLFFDVWRVVEKLRMVNPRLHFLLECTDFSGHLRSEFDLVGATVGVQPMVHRLWRLASGRERTGRILTCPGW